MPDMSPRERAGRGFAEVLKRLPHGRAKELAEQMDIAESALSELKNKHVEHVLQLLAHLGLKVVSTDKVCMPRETFEFLTATHQRVVAKAPELVWSDGE